MCAPRYFDRWPENTDIGWWDEGRKQLNAIVEMVNDWTLHDRPSEDVEQLLRQIDKGLQTFAAQDGGGGWAEVLGQMRDYVKEK